MDQTTPTLFLDNCSTLQFEPNPFDMSFNVMSSFSTATTNASTRLTSPTDFHNPSSRAINNNVNIGDAIEQALKKSHSRVDSANRKTQIHGYEIEKGQQHVQRGVHENSTLDSPMPLPSSGMITTIRNGNDRANQNHNVQPQSPQRQHQQQQQQQLQHVVPSISHTQPQSNSHYSNNHRIPLPSDSPVPSYTSSPAFSELGAPLLHLHPAQTKTTSTTATTIPTTSIDTTAPNSFISTSSSSSSVMSSRRGSLDALAEAAMQLPAPAAQHYLSAAVRSLANASMVHMRSSNISTTTTSTTSQNLLAPPSSTCYHSGGDANNNWGRWNNSSQQQQQSGTTTTSAKYLQSNSKIMMPSPAHSPATSPLIKPYQQQHQSKSSNRKRKLDVDQSTNCIIDSSSHESSAITPITTPLVTPVPVPVTTTIGNNIASSSTVAIVPTVKIEDVAMVPAVKRGRKSRAVSIGSGGYSDDQHHSGFEGDGDKKGKILQKNREAALKCRQKKKVALSNLQTTVDVLTEENNHLQKLALQLREEVFGLKSLLLSNRDCTVALANGLQLDAIEATLSTTFKSSLYSSTSF
ncbi:hypothetical protein HDU76_013152 [Blyttiomyces sp. JEL0837]|nr:hypothetical protein HDU76_013152 [Blyttiomyces sp. JEL0837]